jgi:hypothetical protein
MLRRVLRIKEQNIMRKIASYYITNIAMLAVMYAGLIYGHAGALNVALFFSWFAGICHLGLFIEVIVKSSIEATPTNPAPYWVERFFSIAPVIAWAWHSYWFTAIIATLSWIACANLWMKREKAKTHAEPAQSAI